MGSGMWIRARILGRGYFEEERGSGLLCLCLIEGKITCGFRLNWADILQRMSRQRKEFHRSRHAAHRDL